MTNVTSNVTVGFSAIPRLLVTIVTMSISFLIWPQVGGSLSHICLANGLPSGQWRSQPQPFPVPGRVFQSQSPHLWNQGIHEAWQTAMVPTLGVLHVQEKHKHALDPTTGSVPCHLQVNTFFQRTWGLTIGSCDCQWLSVGVKPCSGQFKKLRVYKALCNWLAGGITSFPPFNTCNHILRVACACSTMACPWGL
jgi:hypothetical protein